MDRFVGREPELDALIELAARARRERTVVAALVVGHPGVGKTRLLGEVATRADPRMERVSLVGYEPSRRVPFAASGELLRHLGLLDAPTDIPQAADPLRTFEAAHRARIGHGPLLLLVDDVQWFDEMTLGLLHYLLRAADSPSVALVVVAAGRPAPATSVFAQGLETALPAQRRDRIELGPLDRDESERLLAYLVPELEHREASILVERSGGSPFWLGALASGGRPRTPREALRSRLDALGRDEGSLVGLLAVAGRPFTVRYLAMMLGWAEPRAGVAAGRLVTSGLAVEDLGAVRLAHDLIRDAAFDRLPAASIRRHRIAIAERLERDQDADLAVLVEALQHRVAAGVRAADLAERLIALPERRLLGAVGRELLQSVARSVSADPPRRLRLELARVEIAHEAGDHEAVLAAWADVPALTDDPEAVGRAAFAASDAAFRLGRLGPARSHLARARAAVGADPLWAIILDAHEAQIEMWVGHDSDAGLRSAERALAAARALIAPKPSVASIGRREAAAYLAALEAASDAATQQSRWHELLELSREIETLAGALDDASFVRALTRAGGGLRQVGSAHEAEGLVARAWRLADELGLPSEAVEAGHWYARVLMDLGRLHDAHAIALQTRSLERRVGHGGLQWGSVDGLAHMLELYMGDPAAALAALRDDAERDADRHHALGIRQTIAEWEARAQGTRAVRRVEEQLRKAAADADAVACPRCRRELEIVSAELEARMGRVEEAERRLEAWSRLDGGEAAHGIWRDRCVMAVALARGEGATAVEAARRVVASAAERHRATVELWARLDLGLALESVDRGAAIEAYERASAVAEATGAVSIGRIASARLRRLGVRSWRRASDEMPLLTEMSIGPAAPPSPASLRASPRTMALERLTRREIDVVERAAAGATNDEIADALVISPKTVERHMTNVFSKLGVRNRAELAARMSVASGPSVTSGTGTGFPR